MNFHDLAPNKYKRSLVAGINHRKSTKFLRKRYSKRCWRCWLPNLKKNKKKLRKRRRKQWCFLQYRGKITEKFEHALKRIEAPCKVITQRKSKSVLPSLKSPVEKALKSCVVRVWNLLFALCCFLPEFRCL